MMQKLKFSFSYKHIVVLLQLVVLLTIIPSAHANSNMDGSISGKVLDIHGQPIDNANINIFINESDQAIYFGKTNQDGVFLIDISSSNISQIKIEISHPHFKQQVLPISDQAGGLIRVPDIHLERTITAGFWISIAVFIIIFYHTDQTRLFQGT